VIHIYAHDSSASDPSAWSNQVFGESQHDVTCSKFFHVLCQDQQAEEMKTLHISALGLNHNRKEDFAVRGLRDVETLFIYNEVGTVMWREPRFALFAKQLRLSFSNVEVKRCCVVFSGRDPFDVRNVISSETRRRMAERVEMAIMGDPKRAPASH